MILYAQRRPFRRVDVRQDLDQPRDPRFLKVNPIGKVPALLLEDGDVLTESGAILFFLARNTQLWPQDPRQQTEALRWMFFEQYSHEPALAVLRYLKLFTKKMQGKATRIKELEKKSRAALDVLEHRLNNSDWMAGSVPTIADYAIYPYTRLAGEISLSLEDWPSISNWLNRFEKLDYFLPIYSDAATEVIAFDEYFAMA